MRAATQINIDTTFKIIQGKEKRRKQKSDKNDVTSFILDFHDLIRKSVIKNEGTKCKTNMVVSGSRSISKRNRGKRPYFSQTLS